MDHFQREFICNGHQIQFQPTDRIEMDDEMKPLQHHPATKYVILPFNIKAQIYQSLASIVGSISYDFFKTPFITSDRNFAIINYTEV